jgi:hypothetical protein
MAIECAYSFRDLYTAAHKREPGQKELQSLYALPQSEKNAVIKRWAQLAGWEVKERIGVGGIIYTAFAPSFKGASDKESRPCEAGRQS